MERVAALPAAGLVVGICLTGCVSAPAPVATNQAQSPASATVRPSKAEPAPPSHVTPSSAATAVIPTEQYVIAEQTEERYVKQGLAPDGSSPVTNTIYMGQRVEVYETRDGWTRVSKYYDGRLEQPTLQMKGEPIQVARWVESKSLGVTRPAPAASLNIPEDTRIQLTRAPGNGLNQRDVLILHAAARYYLETGQAKRIEDGDKSVGKAGVYYLNFGGPQNTFFRPSEIPDLERRIQGLLK